MNIQQLREKLKSVYPGSDGWPHKVNKMSDRQVIAIMMRLKLKGKIK